ncbi:MAG: hypothetical protein CVU77_02460 [Elusimicrobia bacterium HGW-Elusimicrobia-1]|jgi:hypothetical protein|nr:MAG: hypothetical protein CVU77_02460 [Elusimicrobia bacterium HGW-Elusimicrobia-1]
MYIFLDESGDLGFDFSKAHTTSHLVITVLVARDKTGFERAVKRTLKNKVNRRRNSVNEIKGSDTAFEVKKYFYNTLLKYETDFEIYAVILNKRRVYKYLSSEPEMLYAFLSKFLLEKCPFEQAIDRIILTIDKRSRKQGVESFNKYLLSYLKAQLPKIDIYHNHSYASKGLQAVDLFCWGVFRKYERKDAEWYDMYKDKIRFETMYLPQK